jgi:antitoxin FitA
MRTLQPEHIHNASILLPQRKQGVFVATLTLKNFPDDMYAQLKERAAGNRRSLTAEAILCIETTLTNPSSRADVDATLDALRRARSKVRHAFVTNSELRRARRSGRA